MKVDIYVDNSRLDLFGEEQIKVKSSVLDIQDIEKNTTEYSNSFTVPASAANNKIFKHYYNADIDDGFDARTKHPARIELGGVLFRSGNIILQKVNTKSGSPTSYILNFFGELTSLSTSFGTDKLKDLAFADYPDTLHTSDFMKDKLTGSVGSLVSALITNKAYYYNSSSGDTGETNIYVENTGGGLLWSDLRLSLALEEVINAIEQQYDITFSDDLFHSDLFRELYLYLDSEKVKKVTAVNQVDGIDASPVIVDGIVYMDSLGVLDTSYLTTITVDTASEDAETEFTVDVYYNSDLVQSITAIGIAQPYLEYDIVFGSDATLTTVVTSPAGTAYNVNISVDRIYDEVTDTYANGADIISKGMYTIADNMPDITVSDFIKGLVSAFKCVITGNKSIYIDNVENYYNTGHVFDLTKYVDYESVPISAPELLNDISYSFASGETALQELFFDANNTYYGDEDLLIYDDSGELIDGTSKSVELPFEQMVYSRLQNRANGAATDISLGSSIDSDGKEVVMSPHIHYVARRATESIAFINDSGNKERLSGNLIMPTHTPTTGESSFLFGEEIDEYSEATLSDSLYSRYHASYITTLFNKKTRTYDIDCKNVPLHIITDLKLNDTIKIKDDYFRINTMITNLTTGEISLNLLR